MKYKFNKKILFSLLTAIFIVLTIFLIGFTYARYITSLTANSTVELGSWLILVNNQNILQNADVSEVIVPEFNSDSEYIAEGKIAPTSTGHIQININYQKVTVPFKYEISFATDNSTLLEDFKLVSYSINNGSVVTIDEDDYIVTNTISPNEITRTQVIDLNFEWIDGEDSDETFNDIQDTAFSRDNSELGLRFNLEFTQLQ